MDLEFGMGGGRIQAKIEDRRYIAFKVFLLGGAVRTGRPP